MKKFRTVLIDAEKQEIREVVVKEFDDIYKFLKCRTFCIGLSWEPNTALMVDDEGYLKQGPKSFFKLKSFEPMQWLAGNGIIIREEGEDMVDVQYDVKMMKADIAFMQCDDQESCPKLPPPQIISF